MDFDTYIHEVFYFQVFTNKIIGIIPALDYTFSIKSGICDLPSYIRSHHKPMFNEGLKKKIRIKRVLVLTTGCNLNCSYCFEGNTKVAQSMTDSDIVEIITQQFEEAITLEKKIISFSLFGGEPTLRWSGVESAINVATELSDRYKINCLKAIVTNGAMSTIKAKYLSENFDFVYLSLDGPKELFLLQRMPQGGEFSYDNIFQNAKILFNSKTKLNFKITVTNHTINKMPEIDDFFAFHFPTCGRVYQPCMVDKTDALYISFEQFIEKFFELKMYSCFPRNLTMSLYKDSPSDRFCNLQIRNVIYPDKSVLACHRSNICMQDDIVKKHFCFGKCENGNILINTEQKQYIKQFTVDNLTPCNSCYAKYHCCGGCPAIKLFNGLDCTLERATYCETIKKYFLSSIAHEVLEDSNRFVEEYSIIQSREKTVDAVEFTENYVSHSFKLGGKNDG